MAAHNKTVNYTAHIGMKELSVLKGAQECGPLKKSALVLWRLMHHRLVVATVHLPLVNAAYAIQARIPNLGPLFRLPNTYEPLSHWIPGGERAQELL